ncbi:MAG: hypothetical protein U5L10_01515 [Candidatus Moranbacteria bacterium]|nr:hypothetical protein [Candidatus Moranbacteria bacterium]
MEIIQALEQFNQFLEQSYFFRAFKFLLGFYMIVMALTLAGIMYRFGKSYYNLLTFGAGYKLEPGKFQKRWNKAQRWMESDNPANWKAAVLESARMLEKVLNIIGYEGDTLGQKLDNMQPFQLENLSQVKEANKIKNKIVRDESYSITQEEARNTVDVFGESLAFFEAVEK